MIITYNYNGTVSADILFSSYCVCMEGEIFSSNFLLVNVVDFMSISEGNEDVIDTFIAPSIASFNVVVQWQIFGLIVLCEFEMYL